MPGTALSLALRFVEEAWNQGRLEVIREIATVPYRARSLNAGTPPLPPQDHAAIAGHVEDFRRAFSDLALRVEDTIDGGDRAYVQTRLTGTHDGPFMGAPPTGARVDMVLCGVYEAEDGRLTGHTALVDMQAMFSQLGLPPLPPGKP